MAKNNWARDAFRKAQNLMSRGYNDFQPKTVVTKDQLSDLSDVITTSRPSMVGPNQLDEYMKSPFNQDYNPLEAKPNAYTEEEAITGNTKEPSWYDKINTDGMEEGFAQDLPEKDGNVMDEMYDNMSMGFGNDLPEEKTDWNDWMTTYNSGEEAMTRAAANQGATLAAEEILRLTKELTGSVGNAKQDKIKTKILQLKQIKSQITKAAQYQL